MSSVLRISEAASLALHTMSLLATDTGKLFSTQELADSMSASQAHLSKVLQRLARAGLVHASRGPKGGFQLSKAPATTTLLDIYEAIEGPLGTTDCLYSTSVCGRHGCIFGGLLARVTREVREYLAETKLTDVVDTVRTV
jgi:Rrf2 family protein